MPIDLNPAPLDPRTLADATDEALRRTLLTCDGAGTKAKEAALNELLERRFNEGYGCGANAVVGS